MTEFGRGRSVNFCSVTALSGHVLFNVGLFRQSPLVFVRVAGNTMKASAFAKKEPG